MITRMHVVPKGGPHYYTQANKLYRFQSNGLIEGQKRYTRLWSTEENVVFGGSVDNWCPYLLLFMARVWLTRPGRASRWVVIPGFFGGGLRALWCTQALISERRRKVFLGFVAMAFKPHLFPVDWWVITGEEGKGREGVHKAHTKRIVGFFPLSRGVVWQVICVLRVCLDYSEEVHWLRFFRKMEQYRSFLATWAPLCLMNRSKCESKLGSPHDSILFEIGQIQWVS
jgi:hypothetical protein